jgi:hypothetical protein
MLLTKLCVKALAVEYNLLYLVSPVLFWKSNLASGICLKNIDRSLSFIKE